MHFVVSLRLLLGAVAVSLSFVALYSRYKKLTLSYSKSSLSSYTDAKQTHTNEDIYPFIIDSLSSELDSVKLIALKILESYSAFGVHHDKMRENGVIQLLLHALRNSENDLIIRKSAFILSNISIIDANDEPFLKEGVLSILFKISQKYPLIEVDAMQILLNVSARESVTAERMILETDAVQWATESFKRTILLSNQQLQLLSLKTLNNLSSNLKFLKMLLRDGELFEFLEMVTTVSPKGNVLTDIHENLRSKASLLYEKLRNVSHPIEA